MGPAKRFTKSEMGAFLAMAGDANTVHSADHDPVLPGMMVGALISGVMGTTLPGPGSVYMSQSLKFRKEARLSGTYTAVVEVTKLSPSRHVLEMATSVVNEKGEVILDGEALGKNDNPLLWDATQA